MAPKPDFCQLRFPFINRCNFFGGWLVYELATTATVGMLVRACLADRSGLYSAIAGQNYPLYGGDQSGLDAQRLSAIFRGCADSARMVKFGASDRHSGADSLRFRESELLCYVPINYHCLCGIFISKRQHAASTLRLVRHPAPGGGFLISNLLAGGLGHRLSAVGGNFLAKPQLP